MQHKFKVVPICENDSVANSFNDILLESSISTSDVRLNKDVLSALESRHVNLWQEERTKYVSEVKSTANYRLESVGNNYRSRKRVFEQRMRDITDEKIVRMYQSELNTATEDYNRIVNEITAQIEQADIHTSLVAQGVLEIKKG